MDEIIGAIDKALEKAEKMEAWDLATDLGKIKQALMEYERELCARMIIS